MIHYNHIVVSVAGSKINLKIFRTICSVNRDRSVTGESLDEHKVIWHVSLSSSLINTMKDENESLSIK